MQLFEPFFLSLSSCQSRYSLKKFGGVTIFIYFLRLTFFYWSIFSKLVSTHTDSNKALLKFFGLLKVSLFLVIQLKSYEIETVHYRGISF